MNIGIIGSGMVGNAVANGFKNNNLLISDPSLNNTTVKEVCEHSELIFVCVPTPTNNGYRKKILPNRSRMSGTKTFAS